MSKKSQVILKGILPVAIYRGVKFYYSRTAQKFVDLEKIYVKDIFSADELNEGFLLNFEKNFKENFPLMDFAGMATIKIEMEIQ